jgi:hypothetical protein
MAAMAMAMDTAGVGVTAVGNARNLNGWGDPASRILRIFTTAITSGPDRPLFHARMALPGQTGMSVNFGREAARLGSVNHFAANWVN